MSITFHYQPIGVIHSAHHDPAGSPIQPCYAQGCIGTVEVLPEYAEGLCDLDGYSHIYLLYHFHRAKPAPMLVAPFIQKTRRGLFSTRVPGRPNPIGLSIVRLRSRQGNVLHIEDVDVLDGTPLLDIKPYSRRIDCVTDTRNGWQDEVSDELAGIMGRRKAPETLA